MGGGPWHPAPPPPSSSCGSWCCVPSGVRHAAASAYHHSQRRAPAASAVSRLYHTAAHAVLAAAGAGLRDLTVIRTAAARAEVSDAAAWGCTPPWTCGDGRLGRIPPGPHGDSVGRAGYKRVVHIVP
jgi:hypothetical protein